MSDDLETKSDTPFSPPLENVFTFYVLFFSR